MTHELSMNDARLWMVRFKRKNIRMGKIKTASIMIIPRKRSLSSLLIKHNKLACVASLMSAN